MKKIVYCLVNIVYLVLLISNTNAKQCGDPECKTTILLGETAIKFGPSDGYRIAFNFKEKVKILARNVGKDNGYWIQNEKGDEGYAHREAIRESKVLVANADRVEVEENSIVQTTPTQKSEVIDGTTIYENVPASKEPSVTDKVFVWTEPTVVTETPKLEVAPEVVQNIVAKAKSIDVTPSQESDDDDNEDDDEEEEGEEEGEEEEDDEEDTEGNENNLKGEENIEKIEDKVPETLKLEEKNDEVKIQVPKTEPSINEALLEPQSSNVPKIEDKKIEMKIDLPKIAESIIKELKQEFASSEGPVETKIPKLEENKEEVKVPTKFTETVIDSKVITENLLTTAKEEDETAVTLPPEAVKATNESEIKNIEPQKQTVHEVNPEIFKETIPKAEVETTKPETKVELPPDFKPIATATVEEIPILKAPEVNPNQPLKEEVHQELIKNDTPTPIFKAPDLNPDQPLNEEQIKNETPQPESSNTELNESVSTTTPVSHLQEDIPPILEATKPVTQIPPTIIPVYEEPKEHHNHNHKPTDPINILGHGGILTPKPPFRTLQQLNKKEKHLDPEIRNLLMKNDDMKLVHSAEHSHEIRHNHQHEDQTLSMQKNADKEPSYCEKNSCPPPVKEHSNGFYHPLAAGQKSHYHQTEQSPEFNVKMDEHLMNNNSSEEETVDYVDLLITKMLEMSDLIVYMAMTSITLIVFLLVNSCINRNRREKPLIYKLNLIERDLMTYQKENATLQSELSDTKEKLTSIENNSFGSDDQIILLRDELEQRDDQIAALEKELETAAEAGLELNRMVAELLNQTGSDTIAITVDELQRQLNEQQETIIAMNTALAEKSRENSEFQIKLSEQNERFNEDMEELQQKFNDLKLEKSNLEIELKSVKDTFEVKINECKQKTSSELGRVCNELKAYQSKYEDTKKHLTTSEAKVEALEECIRDMKKGNSSGSAENIIDSAELKADLLVLNKEKANLQDRLHGEIIARQLLDDHVKLVNEEISNLKKDFSKAEKEKLEAETRLDVLSSYFKEKETTLQKELREKEALWMKSQGETTSTVERVRTMQDEIQTLKSQNEALRAEIEAQATAHKAQNAALEHRAHEAWLSARQAERKYEESQNEASFLRRKLTTMGDPIAVLPNPIDTNDSSLQAPSPIRVESPKSPLLGPLPPHPFLPPPPFMPGPPFMPFVPPPDELRPMRPAPLGRLMSPPPPNRYSPDHLQDEDRDRYSPNHHGRFSPDSRFDDDHRYDDNRRGYYETETDFSPPPSPIRRPNYGREREFDKRDRGRERDYDDRDRDRDHNARDAGYSKPYSPTIPRSKTYNKGGFNSSESQDSIVSPKKGGKYSKQST